MQQEIMTTKKIEVTNVFRRNQKAKTKYVINIGGAGSSKSYSLCQHLIFDKLINPKYRNYKQLILRKERTSLKKSTYKDYIDILKENGIYDGNAHNMSEMAYTVPSLNNYVLFTGLDDREKIKSTQWHDIWMEEANQFDHQDFLQLKLRLYRGKFSFEDKKYMPRIWMSLNPLDCWVFKLEGKKDCTFIKSTYKDNDFINDEYKNILEGLKDEDMAYYKIYTLGERGIPSNIIYKPFTRLDKYPETFDDECYGIDFGYNAASAVIHVGMKDAEFYLTELLCETKLTNADLIEKLKELIPITHKSREIPIYCDSEDPNRIEEIKNAGFNARGVAKGSGSVKMGIDFCKRRTIYTLSSNINLDKECAGYKWREDKNGNLLDEPVKFNDHCLDAARYALVGHFAPLFQENETMKDFLDKNKNIQDDDILLESARVDW